MSLDTDTEKHIITIAINQLERWTNATGATESAQSTHNHIRGTLTDASVFQEESYCDLHTLLQGSYRTGTLVHGSGDVDILAINEAVHDANNDTLTSNNQADYEEQCVKVDYGYPQFRSDVADVLQDEYGVLAIDNSDGPAIKVKSSYASGISLDADVVPVLRYRYFTDYPSYYEGICFGRNLKRTFNFPEQHISRGESINSNTNGEYNKTARMFKNARNKLVSEGSIEKSTIPSYFIECLLSNVSKSTITTENLQTRYVRVIQKWLDADIDSFTPQHNVANRKLFGDDPQQWNTTDCNTAIQMLFDLFDNWEDYT